MSFTARLKFFLLGTGIGILITTGLFGKRVFSCAYFPNQRILSNLSKKEIIIDKNHFNISRKEFKFYTDPIFIKQQVFTQGEISFSRSLPRRKPFPMYHIRYNDKNNGKVYIFEIENQERKAIVESIQVVSKD